MTMLIAIKPYVTTSCPKTEVYAEVCVCWGEGITLPGTYGRRDGTRFEYVLTDDHLEESPRLYCRKGDNAWGGRVWEEHKIDPALVPDDIRLMAEEALRNQRKRRFDGRGYLPRLALRDWLARQTEKGRFSIDGSAIVGWHITFWRHSDHPQAADCPYSSYGWYPTRAAAMDAARAAAIAVR